MVGGTDGGGGGDGWEGDRYGLSWWEDNLAQITLGTEPNNPFAYAPGLKFYHLIMSTLGDPGVRLERDISTPF